ncbi:MAG: pilus assembly protein [Pirellulales bacterium]|nr:pilus assembly protein [Pirellulales bacterium]
MCRKHRRGAAAVEFAIIAPVFFLLILGMIEIGRGVMVQQIITNASREGARLAILPGTTSQEVIDRVDGILTSSGINGATTRILGEDGNDINPINATYGEVIKVVVTVPFDQVSWLPGADKYLAGKDLTASTTMRGERVQ